MADWPDDVDDDVFEQLDAADTLDTRGPEDPLDEGYSPPERPWAVGDWGVTASEVAQGEGLDARLARELPDALADNPDDGDGIGDAAGTDGEPYDDEVGYARSGRLVAFDEGDIRHTEEELVAHDVGIDGAAASAEEAAVHVIEDPTQG
ncbi:DUF5709 domain-containing protein [Amycolatopsis taiwanensis]|uniref:DUF5709 domain-containing protein n=1 Tax=Amycolatopsis taiwanensis TaxID=342230 RepID=A0A9W6R3G2_9PSEU|nr:DUF5709 domain-containing protein [Amycolatopsis taiwanensis]GLY67828.1 hypothetical protein Atai01_44470 [Amycolatopsis taiwanensis]